MAVRTAMNGIDAGRTAAVCAAAVFCIVVGGVARGGTVGSSAAPQAVFDRGNRDLQLIDDADCESGKALELRFRGRSVAKGPLGVMVTPPVGPLDHGLYRVTARLKMQGLPHSLGTGITLEVRPAPSQPGQVTPPLAARTVYLNEFAAEDAWQDFSLDVDFHPPLLVRTRCDELGVDAFMETLCAGLNPTAAQRAALRAWLLANPRQPLPEKDPPGGFDAATVARLNAVGGSPADVVLAISIPQNATGFGGEATRGNSTPFASLRRLFIDTVGIERVPETAVFVRDLRAEKAWLRPGEKQGFVVDLHNRTGASQRGELAIVVESGLGTRLPLEPVAFDLADKGYDSVRIDWDVPADHPHWGQTAIVEARVGGEVAAGWRTWFTVHPRNTAVMIPFAPGYAAVEGCRFQHPTATKPNVANLYEQWAPTPYDAAGIVPDNLDAPFIVGNSTKVESLASQKRVMGGLRARGIASAFYCEGHGTGNKAWDIYWDHPEWCSPSTPTSDICYLKRREVEQLLLEDPEAKGPAFSPPSYPHVGFVRLNCLAKPVVDAIIADTITLLERVPYTTCRWDSSRPLCCFPTDALGRDLGKTPEELVRQELENFRRYVAEIREKHPGFEVGFNYGHSELMGRRDDPFDFEAATRVIDADPLAKAVLADGGYILEEAWGHSFEVWNDYKVVCRNYLRACRVESAAYKHAGGHHGHMFRDNAVSYAPDDIYQQLFSLLGGAHLCTVNYGPLPESEYDLGVYAARFAEFFWDPRLRQLTGMEEKVAVESEADLWSTEAGFEKDTESGSRIYVLPLINPPVTEQWLKNRYGQLPEPIRQPIAVTVRVPEGFRGVKAVHDLAAGPWPEVRPLEFETDGQEVRFEFPELVTFKVAVVEFTQ